MQPESQDTDLPHKKTLKEKLLRAFTIASAGLLGGVGGHYLVAPLLSSVLEEPIEDIRKNIVREGIDKSIKTTPLTRGEAAIAQMVFGPTFNTSAVNKSYVSRGNIGEVCPASETEGQVVLGCVLARQPHIFMSEPEIFIDDFSRDGGAVHDRTFVFFHEMTHVWQGMTNESEEGCDIDSEDDATPKSFDDYCHEEQGNLVGRYVTIYLMPNRITHLLKELIAEGGPQINEDRAFLQKLERIRDIVETRFPHARQHRLRQEENVTRMLACWEDAGENETRSNACTRQHYVNPLGEPLTTSAQEVTFTLPDGRVTRPAVRLDPALLARR